MALDPVLLAQELIRCASVTPLEAGSLNLIQVKLEAMGFTCHRLPFRENGTEEVDNLFARRGTGSPHFCFAGHVDVVPAGDTADWKYPPFGAEIHGEKLYGRGAEDMKSAIASFVAAASRLHDVTGSISLLLTCDEEGVAINGTSKVLEWMASHGHVPDVCLVGEPTNPDTLGEMVKIGRRGSMTCTLNVRGKQGHVAYPHLADNPVTRMILMLHRMKSHTLDEGTEFFPPSNLEITTVDVGNPAVNVIPARASAKFNIRFNDTHRSGELKNWLLQECNMIGGEFDLDMRVTGEAFLTPPGTLSDLVVSSIKDVTGITPVLSTTGGTSDARFIKEYCPVIEFGTTGLTTHMVDECVKVADIRTLADIYHAILTRYLGQVFD